MTGPRVQVDSGLVPDPVRPAASPVDSFVLPSDRNGLKDLANALSTLSPKVTQIAGLLQERTDDKKFAEGTEAARKLQAQGKSFRDAIREGLISPDQSPFFRLGVKEQFGRITADKFQTTLTMRALAELADSTDPEDFDKLAGEVRQDILGDIGEDADASFLNGFGPRADQHQVNARLAFNSQVSARVIQQAQQQTFREASNAILNGLENDLPFPEIAGGLQITLERAIATGLPGRAAIDRIVKAVSKVVQSTKDVDMFDLLDLVNGKQGPLSGIARVQDVINSVTTRVNTINTREDSLARAALGREKQAAIEELDRQIYNLKKEDPAADITSQLQALSDIGGRPAVQAALGYEQQLQDEFQESAFGIVGSLIGRLSIPKGEYGFLDHNGLMEVFGRGRFDKDLRISIKDLNAIQSQMSLRDSASQDAADDIPGRHTDPVQQLNATTRNVRRVFGESPFRGRGAGETERINAAEFEIKKRFWEFFTENPKAPSSAFGDFLQIQSQGVLKQAAEGSSYLTKAYDDLTGSVPNLQTVSRDDWADNRLMTSEQYFSLTNALLRRIEAGDSEPRAITVVFATLAPEFDFLLTAAGVTGVADFAEFMNAQQLLFESFPNQ